MNIRCTNLVIGLWPAAWVFTGVACVFLDGAIQPALRGFGEIPALNSIAQLWNEVGATWGIVLFLITGAVASMRDRGVTAMRFASCLTLAGIAVQVVKHLVGRVRPNSLDGATHFYGPLAWFRVDAEFRIDSMPSGHTAAAFAMATALSLRWPRFSILWLAIAAGVGICRTLTNSHFPSDVILGACLGTVVSLWTYDQIGSWNRCEQIAEAHRV